MAIISKDGIYRVGDAETGSQIQYLKGTDVGDQEVEYVGAFPDAATTRESERAARISEASYADAPEAKVNPAPTASTATAPKARG